MKSFAIVGTRAAELYPDLDIQSVTLKEVELGCGLIPTPHAKPATDYPLAEDAVLLRVRAFSCNYRDQPLMIDAYLSKPDNCLWPVGSEFVAVVERCGAAVKNLQPGDRVIPDHTYHGAVYATQRNNGVITNNASMEYQIHPARKLIRIPDTMDDPTAAAFSLGAQTAFSMIRKLRLASGSRVLVMSASSNTSLFALEALRTREVQCVIHSSSPHGETIQARFGASSLIKGGEGWHERLLQAAKAIGGFDAVIDPFFDVHASTALLCLKPGGRYVSCGVLKQFSHDVDYGPGIRPSKLSDVVDFGILNNLEFIFNCLGQREDLEQAIAEFLEGRFKPLIDAVYRPGQEAEFLERTFASRERLGKVVFQY